MPRPNKGFSEVLYVYVTPENKKFLDSEKEKAKKTSPNASHSEYINQLVNKARLTGDRKKRS